MVKDLYSHKLHDMMETVKKAAPRRPEGDDRFD